MSPAMAPPQPQCGRGTHHSGSPRPVPTAEPARPPPRPSGASIGPSGRRSARPVRRSARRARPPRRTPGPVSGTADRPLSVPTCKRDAGLPSGPNRRRRGWPGQASSADDSGTHRQCHHLGPVTCPELAPDPGQVALSRSAREVQRLADLLVGLTVGDQLEYLDLARGQLARVLSVPVRGCRWRAAEPLSGRRKRRRPGPASRRRSRSPRTPTSAVRLRPGLECRSHRIWIIRRGEHHQAVPPE